ncbi:hypothetical protein PPACK8108_LOCUS7088 [Phakopsora pachyrhizi]|uniref:Spore coat protein n=1 Tax=Phakopsora pachyrhizi TaxID=170000 RepID=A0AAV0AV00_PHAPC|nr:hypothetical protein PPACK8108_LOCUS7088 [Phakopsora pachyrhizi]
MSQYGGYGNPYYGGYYYPYDNQSPYFGYHQPDFVTGSTHLSCAPKKCHEHIFHVHQRVP